ncbi:phage-shock protein [Loktanella sp. 3ANDIMAR09]|uniref:PspA/IM30 family protein n=1 Tax=Loktanella sp. 3ANDIMAR09 TaxID=1225657 RepID=UPI0006F66604|nr:PspA/IM30 family protein [Loktanella sp. 3ANDIMAR09]KQI67258.1 phage-shock protein [Loktanella sp. 3ANDIMAR09]
MFRTLTTLLSASNAHAETRLRDTFAIELIDQNIRTAEARLKAAKATLASLIQRQRMADAALTQLNGRISDLTRRARQALAAGQDAMAQEAASAIAQMENEAAHRAQTCATLDQRVLRLRTSVETGHRRLIDLRQGAAQARAIKKEQDIQMRLHQQTGDTGADAAEALIARVLEQSDPFEKHEILQELNAELSHDGLTDRMADAGFGPADRVTPAAVLARLTSNQD